MRHATDDAHAPPILLFDGVCVLCHGMVRWLIARDRRGVFRFAALDSPAGRTALEAAGRHDPIPDSVVLIDDAGVHVRSEAALRVARRLGFPWSCAVVFRLLPRRLRDALYDGIARRRYRWFGKHEACPVPTPELKARLLDEPEGTGEPESSVDTEE